MYYYDLSLVKAFTMSDRFHSQMFILFFNMDYFKFLFIIFLLIQSF